MSFSCSTKLKTIENLIFFREWMNWMDKKIDRTTMNDQEYNKQMEMLCTSLFLPIVEIT